MSVHYVEPGSKIHILLSQWYYLRSRLGYAEQESVWYRMYSMGKHQDYLNRLEKMKDAAKDRVRALIRLEYPGATYWEVFWPCGASIRRQYSAPKGITTILTITYPEEAG